MAAITQMFKRIALLKEIYVVDPLFCKNLLQMGVHEGQEGVADECWDGSATITTASINMWSIFGQYYEVVYIYHSLLAAIYMLK